MTPKFISIDRLLPWSGNTRTNNSSNAEDFFEIFWGALTFSDNFYTILFVNSESTSVYYVNFKKL